MCILRIENRAHNALMHSRRTFITVFVWQTDMPLKFPFGSIWYRVLHHKTDIQNVYFFSFLNIFGGHIHMSYFGGRWYPCFGFLVMFPLDFKARVGCLIPIAEVNVMYIPWDPPLVLHIANLLMVSIAGCPPRFISCPKIYYWHQWVLNLRSRDRVLSANQ